MSNEHDTPEVEQDRDGACAECGGDGCQNCDTDYGTTPAAVELLLANILNELTYGDEEKRLPDVNLPALTEVRTYEQGGIMTRDNGLTLYFSGGAEYQITIVRSR